MIIAFCNNMNIQLTQLTMKNKNLFTKIFLFGIFFACLFTAVNSYSQEGKAVVNGRPPMDGATYLSQSTPGLMESGKTYDVSISMKNSGSTTWQKGNYKLKMMNQADAMTKIWGVNDIELGSSIAPGESVTLNFKLATPLTAGTYNLQWQMANGNAFFGEPTAVIPVQVVSETAPPVVKNDVNFNSTFLHHVVSTEMKTDGTYDMLIIMKNTGSMDWKPGETVLRLTTGNADDQKNVWNVSNINLPDLVVAGGEYSFKFQVQAPPESGRYNFQTQLMQNGMAFGDPSPNVTIEVK